MCRRERDGKEKMSNEEVEVEVVEVVRDEEEEMGVV